MLAPNRVSRPTLWRRACFSPPPGDAPNGQRSRQASPNNGAGAQHDKLPPSPGRDPQPRMMFSWTPLLGRNARPDMMMFSAWTDGQCLINKKGPPPGLDSLELGTPSCGLSFRWLSRSTDCLLRPLLCLIWSPTPRFSGT